MKKEHDANRAFWDASSPWWKEKEDNHGLWQQCHNNPSLVLSPLEIQFLKDIEGKTVCVLGSDDNEVAFALAGMGGIVTSVDISEERLQIARERTILLELKLTFIRADVTDLNNIGDNSFDLVYTGGHMSVWISDIRKYYSEAVRILKSGGILIINDYHPFRRIWQDADDFTSPYNYFNRGPYEYTSSEGLPTFEYHWTVADHIQAVLDTGCLLIKVDEHGEKIEDEFWTKTNLDKPPAYLLIIGEKYSPDNIN